MDKLFKLKQHETNVKTEVLAGITTFFTMAYILFTNPYILGQAGMSPTGVYAATCIAAAAGTLIIALFANLPYAQAPGMSLNIFFTFTVCGALGFVWQEALAMVFICGIISLILSLTKLRKTLFLAIPRSLQSAIGGALGLFIAYLGLRNTGIIGFRGTFSNYTSGKVINPIVNNFDNRAVLLALFGIALTIILMLFKLRGAILSGILITTAVGVFLGVAHMPNSGKIFSLAEVSDLKEVAFAFFGNPGLGSLFSNLSKALMAIVSIFTFVLIDTFDTIGTFIGIGRGTGIYTNSEEEKHKEEKHSGAKRGEEKGLQARHERGVISSMCATVTGALAGTSNVMPYPESSSGIVTGGRTGLTSLTTGLLFLICIPFAAVVNIVPNEAVSAALIVTGALMMSSFASVNLKDFEEFMPVFFTVLITAFCFSVSYGLAAGFIVYCVLKIFSGKPKELHPVLLGSTALFILSFILQAAVGRYAS